MKTTLPINNCPLCNASKQSYKFHDWQQSRYVECDNCGLTFQNPLIVTEYENSYWEESIDPDGNRRKLVDEREHKLRNLYRDELAFCNNRLCGGRILDVGCGFGFFLSGLAGSWKKFGLELSEYCADFISKTYPDITVARCRLEENSFDDAFFNVIYNFSFIEHTSNIQPVFSEFNRLLHIGGHLIITTPNIDSFAAKRFKGNYRLLGNPHIVMYSPQTLSKALSMHGFQITNIRYPFFKTGFFTPRNLLRLWNRKRISPPFYGNMMSVYAIKVRHAELSRVGEK